MSVEIAILIMFGALICELIDSSLGMMYGTILSPVLIIAGFNPLVVVPSILLSQAMGGFTAAILHHRLRNADFSVKIKEQIFATPPVSLPQAEFATVDFVPKKRNLKLVMKKLSELGYIETLKKGTTKDLKAAFCITVLGILATIFAVFIAISIPKIALKTYIGVLVLVMGIILLGRSSFKFSWKKITGIGILSAFNKGLSGGGFGPIVTSGQVIVGRDGKSSIGTTTLAEAPICITGFLTYFFIKGIPSWDLVWLLSVGAVIGAVIGPFLTARFKSEKKLKIVLGIITVGLGIFVLINTWFLNIKGAGA